MAWTSPSGSSTWSTSASSCGATSARRSSRASPRWRRCWSAGRPQWGSARRPPPLPPARRLRSAAIPVLTFTALVVVTLFLTGSIVAETVFSYPGVGSLLIDAVRKRDFPQLQAAVLFLSALYVLVNLGVDLLYGYLDPRIRVG